MRLILTAAAVFLIPFAAAYRAGAFRYRKSQNGSKTTSHVTQLHSQVN
jgi:hypothetical protein